MKKFIMIIFLPVILLSSGLFAMTEKDERQTDIDRIKAQLVSYEETISKYNVQSGLDIQQYYYILGMRDAYRNTLLILRAKVETPVHFDSNVSGVRSISTPK